MRNHGRIFYFLILESILVFAGILWAQDAPDRTLIVNGKSAGKVAQIDGRSYVDIETIAQFTNGTVTIEPDRIVLAFPAPGSNSAPSAAASPPPPPPPAPSPGLTRNFASLAIAELAEMREWRGAVGTILAYGVPVVGSWPQDYRDRVEANLKQVELAASTDADQQAAQLLENEFSNLSAWADNVVATRNALNATNTITPDRPQSDQSLAKISNCSRFLSSMLVSGQFDDDPSCH
jgi:hypothetical protein